MRFLVTGGAGFIGRALCGALLRAGHEVSVLDDMSSVNAQPVLPGVRLVRGDICDPIALRQSLTGVAGVFHLAAVSSVVACAGAPEQAARTNLGGTEAVIAAAGHLPLVFTSSAAVYGEAGAIPVTEDLTPQPISAYAEQKLAAETALADLGRHGRVMVLRPFNVFGPGQSTRSAYGGVLTLFAERALAGRALRVDGDGGQLRDFIHVQDVALGLIAAMDQCRNAPAPLYDRLNLCSGQGVRILDLARMVQRLAGSDLPLSFGPARPGDIRHSLGDPGRAARRLGFRPQIGLEDGLRDLLTPRPLALAGR